MVKQTTRCHSSLRCWRICADSFSKSCQNFYATFALLISFSVGFIESRFAFLYHERRFTFSNQRFRQCHTRFQHSLNHTGPHFHASLSTESKCFTQESTVLLFSSKSLTVNYVGNISHLKFLDLKYTEKVI